MGWLIIVFGILGVFFLGFILGIAAFMRVTSLEKTVRALELSLRQLILQKQSESPSPRSVVASTPIPSPSPLIEPAPTIAPIPELAPISEPEPEQLLETEQPPESEPLLEFELPAFTPPPPEPPTPSFPFRDEPAKMPHPPSVDWEQFAGVKLFAWLGGLALFLAVIFFVKYSFDHSLISPPLRVTFGLILGIGAILGGLKLDRSRFAVTVETLTASGISILYGSVFAAHAYYNLLDATPAFAFMSLVTVAAFFLAVRLDARYVAAMGLLGGFLTPPLLSTGQDHALGLFSYVALLDAGLIAVTLKRRWGVFVLLSMIGTMAMQWGWFTRFIGDGKSLTGAVIFLFFPVVYAAAVRLLRRRDLAEPAEYATFLAQLSALAYCWSLNANYASMASGGTLVLTCIVLASAISIPLQDGSPRARGLHQAIICISFLLLLQWSEMYLTDALLSRALASFLVFGGIHAAASVKANSACAASSEAQKTIAVLLPLAILLAMFLPLLKGVFSPYFWPAVLAINLLGLLVAAAVGFAAIEQGLVIITMLMIGLWIGRLPEGENGDLYSGLWGMLLIILLFSSLFIAASLWNARRYKMPPSRLMHPTLLPASLPFFLLIAADMRLTPLNPSPLFVVAILISAVLLALVTYHRVDLAACVAMIGCLLLAAVHQDSLFWLPTDDLWAPAAKLMLSWNTALPLLFLAFCLAARSRLKARRTPWLACALAGPLFFYLSHQLVVREWGTNKIGLMPALWSLPYIAALAFLVKRDRSRSEPSGSQTFNFHLALMAGVALFFITLIFPLQFEKQWITISWTLEAAALLELHRRIPHRGLVLWACALLAICFVRLALNPEVFRYAKGPQPFLLNWFTYTYFLTAISFFFAARRLRRLQDPAWAPASAGMATGGAVILLFYLMNIEIGHAFRSGQASLGQARLVPESLIASSLGNASANLARDMTYSLGWTVFAAILLAVGIRRSSRPARVAGLGLLSIACLKVFFHDLWRLGQLYRVGSFAGLAVIMILVSFLYQKYVTPTSRSKGES